MLKTLVLDIETSPIIAYVWGLKDQNIGLNQIVKDWQVIAFAAKWLGEKKVRYEDVRNAGTEEELLIPLWNLLNEADIVITQNGQSFDGPKLNARFVYYSMPCPSPYRHLDTYRIAKRVFEFTSNKLEYLTDKLCTKYKKLDHSKFPGMSLWRECLNNNIKAWNEMKRYNIHDVLSTEEMYNKIKAWAPETMPKPFAHVSSRICAVCGKGHVESKGWRYANKLKYQRLHCLDCGTWSKGEKLK
jgi:uncharacterized protein YprB with RNaseH-like and TPR domain